MVILSYNYTKRTEETSNTRSGVGHFFFGKRAKFNCFKLPRSHRDFLHSELRSITTYGIGMKKKEIQLDYSFRLFGTK